MADLADLTLRATGGDPIRLERMFHSELVNPLLNDPFWIWCTYHAPLEFARESNGESARFEQDFNTHYEDGWIERHYPDAIQIDAPVGNEALQQTLQAMIDGESVIRGGFIGAAGQEIFGRVDLLVRSDQHDSDLGHYHYRAVQITPDRRVGKEHRLIGTAFNWVLGILQGYTPDTFDVALKLRTEPVHFNRSALVEPFRLWKRVREGELRPEPLGIGTTASPWTSYADQLLLEERDLTLLPNCGPAMRKIYRERGIHNIDELAAMDDADVIESVGKAGLNYLYHARAWVANAPYFKDSVRPEVPVDGRRIFVHVQNCEAHHRYIDTTYTWMIGVCSEDGEHHAWVARNPEEEPQLWSSFLDWLGSTSDTTLLTWTSAAREAIQRALPKYLDLIEPLLATRKSLFNTRHEVTHRPFLPVSNYSMRSIAPLSGYQKRIPSSMETMGRYWKWLATGDVTLLERLIRDNRVCCHALASIDRWVQAGARTEAAASFEGSGTTLIWLSNAFYNSEAEVLGRQPNQA